MEDKKKKRLSILGLLILVLALTIGYSYLSTNLHIEGTSTIGNATWNVHFQNIAITTGSVTATNAPTIASGTSITYTVALAQPGDFYEFTVDVKNEGSVNAKLSALPTISGVGTEQDVYTNYTFTHTDGTPIAVGETLNAGASRSFTVRVEYDSNITASQLPTSPQNLTLTVDMAYEQA